LTELNEADLDRELVDNYAAALGAPEALRLLEAREVMVDGRLTIGGALLFSRNPARALASAQVRVSRFKGAKRESGARQNLIGDDRLEGPIPRLLDAARESVRQFQPTRRALAASGRFEDIGLVPEDAWLEGIVNAVVHRSYSIQGDYIHVNIYDDRIVIESPGRFPGLVDPSNPLAIKRFARNPRIARVCTDLRITQEFGEGIRRMFDEMRAAGLGDPLYRQTAGSVELTLSGESTEKRLTNALPVVQRQIIAALREATELSTGEVAAMTGAARPTVIRHLNALRDAGYAHWAGKSRNDPRASWRLNR
jgi:ATP-dependent DNA helicase RecG